MSDRPSEPGSVTRAVNGIGGGAAGAEDPTVARIRTELERMARSGRQALGGAALSTGDLVHEAYLKLFGRPASQPWQSRRHFYGSAVRAMEQVLVDALRRRDVERRHAGQVAQVPIVLPTGFPDSQAGTAIESLAELERIDPLGAEVVRLRAIAGLSAAQVAEMLGFSHRTAERKWTVARAWLHARMSWRMVNRPPE
jgi:RNA polymerase sigma factor (TIGR02999 family)